MDETWDRVKNGGGGWTLWWIKRNVAWLENIIHFLWNFVFVDGSKIFVIKISFILSRFFEI